MADFLTRLAERTLGLATVAQPIIAPVFVPAPAMPDQLEDMSFNEVPGSGHAAGKEIGYEQAHPRELVSPVNPEAGKDGAPAKSIPTVHMQDGINTPARIQDTSAADTPVHDSREVEVRRGRMETLVSYDHAGTVPQLVLPPKGIDPRNGYIYAPDNAPQSFPVVRESLKDTPQTSFRAPTVHPTQQERKNEIPFSSAQYLEAATVEKTGPTIRVTIGRIEVQAVMPAKESAARTPPARPRALLSLDDYLKQRNGGQR